VAPGRRPAAEVDVPADLVRRLLAAQQPDLAGLPLSPLANGWDNVMYRLGRDLAVRLPRRAAAAALVEHEQRWLPGLAPGLPLPVPVPVRAGRPGAGYPWAWSVVPYLPGRPAVAAPPADPGEAAAVLAGFLGALHAPAPDHAPANPVRGVPLADRADAVAGWLDVAGAGVDRGAVLRLWESAVAAPRWAGPRLWLHGDLHPGNILVAGGRISGVIDFGDVTAGDPATDLSVAWMLLPAGERGGFRRAYRSAAGHPVDAHTWLRARGWALAMSLAYLAHSADDPSLATLGRRTLAAALDPAAG
jgi:aminoglycoside phosphotransferase (APT) family kinase protein